MNIYEVLASGSWTLFRRANWPVWMQVGSESVPEGEEFLHFGLDLKVTRTCNGIRQDGNYMIDGRDYQKGAGRIKLKLAFYGMVRVWDIVNLEVTPKDEHTIASGEMWISYTEGEFEHVRWFRNVPE